ncbi:MAG: 50S ribosomal protein L4 [Patescibacteria group bacterium]|nr:50S ribosomal protein L4 [Patescibacteria group bacterium]MCL5093982.1 50S ribosomal protein L4 [Patescibacteria group bacterium]
MKVAVYDKKGTKKSDLEIKSKIFDVKDKEKLLSEVVVMHLSNARLAQAKTKKRGEVSGGGKKPYRQKGTGRARTGSIRNPIWRGGGNIFGPTGEENHYKMIPKKKKRGALIAALALKKDNIIGLDKFDIKEPKTKESALVLSKLPIQGRVLLVLGEKDDKNMVKKAFGNIKKVDIVFYKDLNAMSVLRAGTLVFAGDSLTEAIKQLEK